MPPSPRARTQAVGRPPPVARNQDPAPKPLRPRSSAAGMFFPMEAQAPEGCSRALAETTRLPSASVSARKATWETSRSACPRKPSKVCSTCSIWAAARPFCIPRRASETKAAMPRGVIIPERSPPSMKVSQPPSSGRTEGPGARALRKALPCSAAASTAQPSFSPARMAFFSTR